MSTGLPGIPSILSAVLAFRPGLLIMRWAAEVITPHCAELLASSALSDDNSDDGQPFKRIHARRAAERRGVQRRYDGQDGSRAAHVASPLKPIVTRRSVTYALFLVLIFAANRSGPGRSFSDSQRRLGSRKIWHPPPVLPWRGGWSALQPGAQQDDAGAPWRPGRHVAGAGHGGGAGGPQGRGAGHSAGAQRGDAAGLAGSDGRRDAAPVGLTHDAVRLSGTACRSLLTVLH